MGIRDAFKLSWEQAVLRMAMLDGVEIMPESRTIVRSFHLGPYPLAEFCMVYGEKEYPKAITSRFSPDALLLSAYLHIWEQRGRLEKAGIVSRLVIERGLVQCIYLSKDFAESLEQS